MSAKPDIKQHDEKNTFNMQNLTDEFEQLLNNAPILEKSLECSVVSGIITEIQDQYFSIDIGMKSEGRIPTVEFMRDGETWGVGDKVDVYVEHLEGRRGQVLLSRDKAVKESAWDNFEKEITQGDIIRGKVLGRVKGGFAVEVGDIIAFLPGSQIDTKPIKDFNEQISTVLAGEQEFQVLKVDKEYGNVVISRKAIIEESRKEAKMELLSSIQEGDIMEGVVKNITDYGAFIDLKTMDGLLHITDISWKKISHPSEVLELGQTIKVMIIKYSPESQRISLGLKQLEKNPWEKFADKYKVGAKFPGIVTSIVDYGAFVELAPDVEGLVYHTEISWNTKNIYPRKYFKIGDQVDVVILEIDIARHRIGLSIKRCHEDPWKKFANQYSVGSIVVGKVRNIADFGIFMTVGEGMDAIDVLIPATEISWDKSPEIALKDYNKGDAVEGVVLNIDLERERVTVGIKQKQQSDSSDTIQKLLAEKVATCKVLEVKKDGIEVELPGNFTAFIKRGDISKHKEDQKPEKFAIGDEIDVKVFGFDRSTNTFNISIRALEIEQEKNAIKEFGSTDSGASLGHILGAALGNNATKKQD